MKLGHYGLSYRVYRTRRRPDAADVLPGRVRQLVPPRGRPDRVEPVRTEPPLERRALGGIEELLPADVDQRIRITNEELGRGNDRQSGEVGLIRFRGHFPKGGDDVQNGITHSGKTRMPAVQ